MKMIIQTFPIYICNAISQLIVTEPSLTEDRIKQNVCYYYIFVSLYEFLLETKLKFKMWYCGIKENNIMHLKENILTFSSKR